jgi:frizzled protein 4
MFSNFLEFLGNFCSRLHFNCIVSFYRNYMELLENNFDKLEPAKGVNIQCGHLKKSFKYVYNKKKETCVPKCEAEISFSMENKTNTASLVMALSAFCFALSLFTLMVYILNSCCWSDLSGGQKTTTAFAESSPAFLALAFVGYSFGYLISQIGLQHDSKWLCVSNSEEEHSGNNHPELLVASEGQRSQPCIVIFLFVYYFGSAAAAWWPVVAFSWSLAQYFQLPKNTMATVTMFGHLYGWGIPAIFTLAAIVQHLIEADELTSICLPGALQVIIS